MLREPNGRISRRNIHDEWAHSLWLFQNFTKSCRWHISLDVAEKNTVFEVGLFRDGGNGWHHVDSVPTLNNLIQLVRLGKLSIHELRIAFYWLITGVPGRIEFGKLCNIEGFNLELQSGRERAREVAARSLGTQRIQFLDRMILEGRITLDAIQSLRATLWDLYDAWHAHTGRETVPLDER
jgi:hypothetical protein